MQFNSIEFLIFFPVICIIYWSIKSLNWRNYFLLGASYYFYMNWNPVYGLLLLSSTLITYFTGLAIEKYSESNIKKSFLILNIVLNISILFFFKYYGFAAENISHALNFLGISISLPKLEILLPVGISFYTFQALGYSIDVYRGKIKAERNFFYYALFVSFFPQLVAGPIERSHKLLPQFRTPHKFDGDMALEGLKLMIWGYFLKLVVSDRCAMYVDPTFNHLGDAQGYSALIAGLLFPFQLYGDFAGYSFIAIGSARIMGFKLIDNFNRPYLFSTSVQDYWKRNHISLTSWFMDYIYYPLTELRNSIPWWYASIFIVFLLSGFWHGAAWTFVVWGAIQGIMLVFESMSSKKRKKFEKKHKLKNNQWYLWAQRVFTFIIISLSLVFFRAKSMEDAWITLNLIFSPSNFSLDAFMAGAVTTILSLAILLIKEGFEEYSVTVPGAVKYNFLYTNIWMIFLIFCIAWLGVVDGGSFIYFQF